MTLVATQGLWMPGIPPLRDVPQLQAGTIDATGEKFAFIGRVWNKDRASKTIERVGFRFGTVTKSGGSALTVSLQDVNAAAGPPFQPDGTPDETVAIANGDGTFVSNTWHRSGTLSAGRSVTFGELLAVVIEYDGSGRSAPDTVGITTLTGSNTPIFPQTSGTALYTASWANGFAFNGVVLEFSDGTFGTLDVGFPCSAINTVNYNSASGSDEIAMVFQVPFNCKIDGMYGVVGPSSSAANFDLIIYEGTTSIASHSFDANTVLAATPAPRLAVATISEVALSKNTTYYLAAKPTTATNIQIYTIDVANADHWQVWPGGTAWNYTARVDGGSWDAPTTTKRPFSFGIRISQVDDGMGLVRPTYGLGI
jgi:hypothetical protein